MIRTMAKSTLRPLVLCGPSGSGKSTLLTRLLKDHEGKFGFSVSHTTRKPRPGEKDGVHYNFVDKDVMQAAIDNGEFIETAVFSGNLYGTSKTSVQKVQDAGKVCILDIDVQGVKQVIKTDMNPLMIFVNPPSLDVLEKRLRDRKTETEDSLLLRMQTGKFEIEYGTQEGNFHYILVNDDFNRAYQELVDIIFKHFTF